MSGGLTRRMAAVVAALVLAPIVVVFLLVRTLLSDPVVVPVLPTVIEPVSQAPEAALPPAQDRSPEIRGRILDAEGNAVRAATVRLVTPTAPVRVIRDTTTDRDGAFSFAHLPEGRARVDADHDPEGFVSSAVFAASAGHTTEVTLVLSATSGVRGTVTDGDKPVAGATVTVEGVPWAVPGATTDEQGAFHLTIVPDEATGLIAVARAYRTARVALPRQDPLAVHGETVVRIELTGAPAVEGEVAGVTGEAVRAEVIACAGEASEARTESGEDGTFELPSSAIGCGVIAEMQGFAPSDPVTAESGKRLRLRLKPGGAIEGFVVDERGAGVPTFTLGIEAYSSARHRQGDGGRPRGFEDPRGAFRLDNLAPGSYVLTASTSGRPPARSEAIEVVGGAPTRGVRIVLAKGGSVSGVVYDEGHKPLADVEVGFDSVSSVLASNASARTDDRGRYKLDGAPAGPLTLRVQKSGYRMRLVSGLEVSSGSTLAQDVTLTVADGGPGMELTGIGATLKMTDQGIELGSVGPGEPAERAGLTGGDRVVSIDGQGTEGMSVADVVQRLRGKAGSTVDVSVVHKGGESLDVTIERAAIVR